MKELNKIWFWWKPWFDYDVVTRYDIPINICVLTEENNYIVNFADNESLLSSKKKNVSSKQNVEPFYKVIYEQSF